MRGRSPAHESAQGALQLALAAVGLSTSEPRSGDLRADLIVTTPDGRSFEVEVTATSIATEEQIGRLLHWRGEGVVPILVADQVPAPVRRALDERNLSWLDRRGHLRLTAPGLFVDADVPATERGA